MISSTSACDSPAIASSAISSLGSAAMARASSSLRISICVRSRGSRSALAGQPDLAQQLQAARVDRGAGRGGRSPGRSRYRGWECGGSRPATGWRRAAAAGSCAPGRGACVGAPTARPAPRSAKRTLPLSLCRVPQMQLTRVDLPEPFGPIRPSRSPGWTSRSIDSRATKPPKRLPRPATCSSAVIASSGTGRRCPGGRRSRRRPSARPRPAR